MHARLFENGQFKYDASGLARFYLVIQMWCIVAMIFHSVTNVWAFEAPADLLLMLCDFSQFGYAQLWRGMATHSKDNNDDNQDGYGDDGDDENNNRGTWREW